MEEKTKKTRVRKAASCNPCRSKKLRCDRGLPCAACVAAKKPESCIWDSAASAPLYTARERYETEDLRQEVNRLQSLIDILMSKSPASSAFSENVSMNTPSIGTGTSSASSHSLHASPGSNSVASSVYPAEVKDDDLATYDLAQRLGQLTIQQFMSGQQSGGDTGPENLINEAQRILDNKDNPTLGPEDNFVYGMPSTGFSVFPFSKTTTASSDIMDRLPPRKLAEAASSHYFAAIDWYIHPLPKLTFDTQVEEVWHAQATGTRVDPFSLAVVFSIWSVGLFGMPESKALRKGFVDKEATAREWLELAANSLALGRFLEAPTTEAIRALLILAIHYIALSPGDDGGAGVAFLVLSVQCCLQLQLHRDPGRIPGRYSPAEAEDRRRLFWLTFVADQLASSATGRRYTMLHLRDIDTQLPADVEDENMGQPPPIHFMETNMSSLIIRIRIAQLAEAISEEIFGLQAVSYSQINQLDNQVTRLEEEIPSIYSYASCHSVDMRAEPFRILRSYMISLSISQERLRLHRPYLARSYSDEATYGNSRNICLRVAKEILEIQASPLCSAAWAGLNYKSVCASVVLAIDILYRPNSSDAPAHRRCLNGALKRIEAFAGVSTICRRGSKLIRFLLAKDAGLGRPARPQQKRTKHHESIHDVARFESTTERRRSTGYDAEQSEEPLRRKLSHSTQAPTPYASTSKLSDATTSSSYYPPRRISSPPSMYASRDATPPTSLYIPPPPTDLSTFDFNALLSTKVGRTPPFYYSRPQASEAPIAAPVERSQPTYAPPPPPPPPQLHRVRSTPTFYTPPAPVEVPRKIQQLHQPFPPPPDPTDPRPTDPYLQSNWNVYDMPPPTIADMHHPSFYPVDAHQMATLRDYDTMLTPTELNGLTDNFGFTWADYNRRPGLGGLAMGEAAMGEAAMGGYEEVLDDLVVHSDVEYGYGQQGTEVYEREAGGSSLDQWDQRRG